MVEADSALPFRVQSFENQGGITADADDIPFLHLAYLPHQFGGALPLVELNGDLVDGPGADEGVLILVAAKQGCDEAQKEKNLFFHGA